MLINRYGLKFGPNKSEQTYSGTGLKFRSYYRLICLRCGWSFAQGRWKTHRMSECNEIKNNPSYEEHTRRNRGLKNKNL